MKCFLIMGCLGVFSGGLAAEQPQCVNGVCRPPRAQVVQPEPMVLQPTRVAPLPLSTVETRPQQSVLMQPIPPRRDVLRWLIRRR